MAKLLRWWLSDRDAAHRRVRGQRHSQDMHEHTDAFRVLRLMSEGDMSRAIKLLTSVGLADTGEEAILCRLAAKLPGRKEEMPEDLNGFG
eukprot:8785376-Karenia_brevis.AAC.1